MENDPLHVNTKEKREKTIQQKAQLDSMPHHFQHINTLMHTLSKKILVPRFCVLTQEITSGNQFIKILDATFNHKQ